MYHHPTNYHPQEVSKPELKKMMMDKNYPLGN